jgi:hypothetical protein
MRNFLVLALICLLGVIPAAAADTFAANGATFTGDVPTTSTHNQWEAVLSVGLTPAAGDVLVLATFATTTRGAGSARNGSWRLRYGDPLAQGSQIITRWLSGSTDSGAVTLTHIFTGLSAIPQTFYLDHRDYGSTITTAQISLVAIALTSDTARTLQHNQYASDVVGTTTNPTDTELNDTGAHIFVPVGSTNTNENNIFIAASFQSDASATLTGEWDLQIDTDLGFGETWVTVGQPTKRYISATGRPGSITLYAIAENLPAGYYDIRLRHYTNTGTLTTSHATLAGVSLQTLAGYLPYFQTTLVSPYYLDITSAVLQPHGVIADYSTSTNPLALNYSTRPTWAAVEYFVGGSFYGERWQGSGNVDMKFAAGFVDSTVTKVYNSVSITRNVDSAGNFGSGGSVGLTTLASAVHYPFGYAAATSSDARIHKPNIVGFGLTTADTTLITLQDFRAFSNGDNVAVEWRTLSEVNNAGFNIWRSETADGIYKKLTESLIPARGGETWGADYSFEDFDVIPGNFYYYQLEDIEYSGLSSFHGPVSTGFAQIDPLFPEDGRLASTSNPLDFYWNFKGLDRFRIQFSKTADFISGVYYSFPGNSERSVTNWIFDTQYKPSFKEWIQLAGKLPSLQILYWRIYGEDGTGRGFTSEARALSFHLEPRQPRKIIK